MKNFVQPGENIHLTATATVASGLGVLVGSLFGINSNAVVSGDAMVLVTEGVFDHAKTAAQAVAVGDKIYWDDTAKLVTTTVGSNKLIGVAVAAASGAAATARFKLGLVA